MLIPQPINLCNFTYNIILKVLTNRLKDHLWDIITPFKNTFVTWRQLQNNFLLAHNAFHYLWLKQKAYDWIERIV